MFYFLLVMSELPALWPDLQEILNVEGSLFLPPEVSAILKKLIKIRNGIYVNSPNRYDEDVYDYPWDELSEHPTQFYPNWKILNYLKKYNVRNVKDQDFCNKKYKLNGTQAAGVFSAGCTHGITMGFELTPNQESPHNAFRLLQCRDIHVNNLKGNNENDPLPSLINIDYRGHIRSCMRTPHLSLSKRTKTVGVQEIPC